MRNPDANVALLQLIEASYTKHPDKWARLSNETASLTIEDWCITLHFVPDQRDGNYVKAVFSDKYKQMHVATAGVGTAVFDIFRTITVEHPVFTALNKMREALGLPYWPEH